HPPPPQRRTSRRSRPDRPVGSSLTSFGLLTTGPARCVTELAAQRRATGSVRTGHHETANLEPAWASGAADRRVRRTHRLRIYRVCITLQRIRLRIRRTTPPPPNLPRFTRSPPSPPTPRNG